MKYKKSVYKSLALLSQIGISMIVPIALCVAIGIWIDSKFNTYWVIPLMFLGMIAGGRNVYRLAKTVMNDDTDDNTKARSNKEKGDNNDKGK